MARAITRSARHGGETAQRERERSHARGRESCHRCAETARPAGSVCRRALVLVLVLVRLVLTVEAPAHERHRLQRRPQLR
jgi:hypothetical protein